VKLHEFSQCRSHHFPDMYEGWQGSTWTFNTGYYKNIFPEVHIIFLSKSKCGAEKMFLIQIPPPSDFFKFIFIYFYFVYGPFVVALVTAPNGVYLVFTELFEIGVNRKVLFFYDHNSGGQLCWCTRRREIDGKGGRRVSSTGISRRAYGESHWLSFQWAIFDPSRNESEVVSIERGMNFTTRAEILRSKSHWFKKYDHF
jgi:hypothetical protein